MMCECLCICVYREWFGQHGNWMQRHWLIKFQRTQKCSVSVYFWVTSRVAWCAIASFQNSRDIVLLRSYLDCSSGKARDDHNVLRTSLKKKKSYVNVWHDLVIIPDCLLWPHALASNCKNPMIQFLGFYSLFFPCWLIFFEQWFLCSAFPMQPYLGWGW